MSGPKKSKKGPSPAAGRLVRLVGYVKGPGRVGVLAALIAAAFLGGWYLIWQRVGSRLLGSDDYWVRQDNVDITPLPEWIHSDVRAQVFRDASLDEPLSLLDDNLTQRIAGAFSLHPWVAQVHQVSKHHPARVVVELEYRCPVCMVEVPGGWYPVDADAVVLPAQDFSPVEVRRYPRLVGIDSVPVGPVGNRWGDPRVRGGSQIASVLKEAWQELKLDRIVAEMRSPTGLLQPASYEIFARDGTRILWGRAPGAEAPGELSAEEKMARLKQCLAQGGDSRSAPRPRVLDLREANPPIQPAATAARPSAAG